MLGYEKLQKTIDATIEKKKMQILFAGEEEKYREALMNLDKSETDLAEAKLDVDKAIADFAKKVVPVQINEKINIIDTNVLSSLLNPNANTKPEYIIKSKTISKKPPNGVGVDSLATTPSSPSKDLLSNKKIIARV